MLVDAQHPRVQLKDLGQGEEAGFGQYGADRPPGDRERGGGFGDGPAGSDDLVNDLVAEPGSGAGTARVLGGGFVERETRAGHFLAMPAVLGPENLDGASDRDVPNPLKAAFLPPRCDNTAGGAARQGERTRLSLGATTCPQRRQSPGHSCREETCKFITADSLTLLRFARVSMHQI